MKVPNPPGSGKGIAKTKGVRGDAESEERWRQISGLTNRNPIRHSPVDEVAIQTEVQMLYGTGGVNGAGGWKERGCSYPRRSCR